MRDKLDRLDRLDRLARIEEEMICNNGPNVEEWFILYCRVLTIIVSLRLVS